ncbi:MAG: acyl-CoA dehydrogenase family protein [Chromatiales bacterium]
MTSDESRLDYRQALRRVITEVVEPAAGQIDAEACFPRAAITALGRAGLLGLISSAEVGGLGGGHRAATRTVEALAQACASTAMVTCMHYAAAAVIEAHGPRTVREAIARGDHLTTLAFSEAGSRSQFWAPMGTASSLNGHIVLSASKSWVTSAGEADSYVWSSRPLATDSASTLWLVQSTTKGLSIPSRFNGLGLRGNASSPVIGEAVQVAPEDRLGPDGGGFDLMIGVVLPYFQVMSAGMALGTMEAALAGTVEHLRRTSFDHLNQTLADLPTVRAYVARMRTRIDMVRGLAEDTLTAIEQQRQDSMLRVLEVKAAAAEAATEVTDLAMRVCGGAAYRKEFGVERHFRDARAATVMAPTTDMLYEFIGKAVCGLPVFG